MYCSGCKFEVKGACVKQVNINVIYEEGGDEVGCPYRSTEKVALWASNQELTRAAKNAMKPHDRLDSREILWPEGQEDCLEIVKSLVDKYDFVYSGFFPSRAIKAIKTFHWSEADQCYHPGKCQFYSLVSVPLKEPDTDKVRFFGFVGWAQLI
jgi:hypothetical protein